MRFANTYLGSTGWLLRSYGPTVLPRTANNKGSRRGKVSPIRIRRIYNPWPRLTQSRHEVQRQEENHKMQVRFSLPHQISTPVTLQAKTVTISLPHLSLLPNHFIIIVLPSVRRPNDVAHLSRINLIASPSASRRPRLPISERKGDGTRTESSIRLPNRWPPPAPS